MQTKFQTIEDRLDVLDRAYMKLSAGERKGPMRPIWEKGLFSAEDRFRSLYPDAPEDCFVAAWDEVRILQAIADEHGDDVVSTIFGGDGERSLTESTAGVLRAIVAKWGEQLVFALFAATRERASATAH